METPDTDLLLESPELVRPLAPWCAPLDNLHLAILLVTLPWIAGDGLRLADLERRLDGLGPDMPVGPVYFQRVRRAAAALEAAGALEGRGSGRRRRFMTRPEGFAALILNLRILRLDPTLDASEFEFKRALVAMWNVVAQRLVELSPPAGLTAAADRFFERVEALTVWGRRVITERLMDEAFDVLRLVDRQRTRVQALRQTTALSLDRAEARAGLIDPRSLVPLVAVPPSGESDPTSRQILDVARSLASQVLPALRARSTLLRYDAYLSYLDSLTALYARQARVVDIGRLRVAVHGRVASRGGPQV